MSEKVEEKHNDCRVRLSLAGPRIALFLSSQELLSYLLLSYLSPTDDLPTFGWINAIVRVGRSEAHPRTVTSLLIN